MTYADLEPAHNPGGRPPKLTPQLEADIAKAIRGGATLATAATTAGTTYDTVQDWVQRGQGRHPTRKSTPAYARFARELTRAREEARLEALALIQSAARGGRKFEERQVTTRTVTAVPKDGESDLVTETVVTETVTTRVMLPDWRGAAWLLEHSYPAEYGRATRPAEAGGAGGAGAGDPLEARLGRRLMEAIRESAAEGRQLPAATGQGIRYAEVIDEDGDALDLVDLEDDPLGEPGAGG